MSVQPADTWQVRDHQATADLLAGEVLRTELEAILAGFAGVYARSADLSRLPVEGWALRWWTEYSGNVRRVLDRSASPVRRGVLRVQVLGYVGAQELAYLQIHQRLSQELRTQSSNARQWNFSGAAFAAPVAGRPTHEGEYPFLYTE